MPTRKTHHSLPVPRLSLPPFLTAAVSIPIALALSLETPGDQMAYVFGIVSLGILASIDLVKGLKRLIPAFVVSFLASTYTIEHSVIGQGFPPLSLKDTSIILVSLPLTIGVLVSGFLFSHGTRYKFLKANLVASLTVVIGLAVGTSLNGNASAPLDSAIFTSVYFLLLGFQANIIQIVLFQFLDKLWKARGFSLAMMPTAFFAYNLLGVIGYLNTHSLSQLYTFFSSLAFLPAIALAGIGSGSLARRLMGVVGNMALRITVAGSPLIRQGQDQTIKIATETGGKRKSVATIVAKITRPGGSFDLLNVSQGSSGEYKASYHPSTPGKYTVQVTATSKEKQTADKSFSFTVQPQPQAAPQHSFPRPLFRVRLGQKTPVQSRPAPPPARPVQKTPSPPPPQHWPPVTPPIQRPPPSPSVQTIQPVRPSGLSKLENWDPKAWVNQNIHGYTVKEHLATGLTGYVLRASFGQAGTEMALKIPILRSIAGTAQAGQTISTFTTTNLDETMTEASRLLELSAQSKYMVQLRGILVDRLNVQEIVKGNTALYLQSPPAIIMEFMKGGTAKKLVEDPVYDSLFYSEKWGTIVVLLGSMIATALSTIHEAGFVHLDVKPQNILFNSKPPVTGQEMIDKMQSGSLVPKLGDLGSAVRTGGKVGQFTSEYAPGEQVLGAGAHQSMDVYALGATIYNMLTKTPVNSKKLIETMNNMINNPDSDKAEREVESTWSSFTPDLARIDQKFSIVVPVLKEMLAKDSRNRPTSSTVVSSLQSLKAKLSSR